MMVAKKAAVILIFILLTVAVTAVLVDSFGYLEQEGTCDNCHSMQPYIESFNNPANDSVISRHINITCIDCHGGTQYKHRLDAQLTVLKKIGLYTLTSNVSDVDKTPLAVNCNDCHLAIGDSMAHTGNTACGDCHLAHREILLPKEFNELECSKCHKLPQMGGNHTTIDCRGCHIQHGYKPDCTQCHPPHATPGTPDEGLEAMAKSWTNDVCYGCHNDYHAPSKKLIFGLSPDMDKELCAGCHSEYEILKTYGSFHNELSSCANCHLSHGRIDVRSCNTRYCHGGIRYETPSAYKKAGDKDTYRSSSMCATCHGPGPKDLHFNAPEHSECRSCHGIPHWAAHVRKYDCSGCHKRGRTCTECHDANIHKLKA